MDLSMDFIGEAEYAPLEDEMVIISDIHGDADSLKAALSDAGVDPSNPKPVICLGDIAGEYGQTSECIRILREIGAKCVRGNHDIFEDDGMFAHSSTDVVNESQLERHEKEWLNMLPDYLVNDEFVACHAAPSEPHTLYMDDEMVIEDELKMIDQRVLFTGHTHEPDYWMYRPWCDIDGTDQPTHTINFEIGKSRPDRGAKRKDRDLIARTYINPGSITEPRGTATTPTYLIWKNDQSIHWKEPGYSWDSAYDKLSVS